MKHALALSIIQAMAAIHGKGICHMDVKPQNVMCFDTIAQAWKFIDMDNARKKGEKMTRCISWKTASPEHNKYIQTGEGEGVCDTSSDVFSLGMTLIYMYTGNFLYEEEEEAKAKMGQLKEENVSCQTLHRYMKRYGVDCEVAADMLSRMLEVEPKKRWTAQALIAHGLFTGRDATRVEKEKAAE